MKFHRDFQQNTLSIAQRLHQMLSHRFLVIAHCPLRSVSALSQRSQGTAALTVWSGMLAVPQPVIGIPIVIRPEMLEVVEKNAAERRRKLDELLEEFSIAHLRKAPSIALSGGERRRCEIARALASDPAFMLLDEPFAGVDPIAVSDIQELVRHLTQRGIGVLITDHNVRETLSICDRAYILADGEVIAEGAGDKILSDQKVRDVYLGEDFRL